LRRGGDRRTARVVSRPGGVSGGARRSLLRSATAHRSREVFGMFRGAYTALVTPMRDGRVDDAALERLVDAQIEGGIHGLVPCGTTGESPALSHAEHV